MTFRQLVDALAGPLARPHIGYSREPRGDRHAAVLLLFSERDDPEITFIRRADGLRTHAGQIAFPGGRIDPGEDAVTAALRETTEEVGLDEQHVEVVGALPSVWVSASNYDVTGVLGIWPGGKLEAVDKRETADVLQYPVSTLASVETRRTAMHPSGYRGPAFVLPNTFIWGLTAYLLDWALRLGGWEQQWDHNQTVAIPEQYLRDRRR